MFGMMIWGVDFEQDLRPLIKAFYPGCDFTVQKGEIEENIRDVAEWMAFLEKNFPKEALGATGEKGAREGFLPGLCVLPDGVGRVFCGSLWVGMDCG